MNKITSAVFALVAFTCFCSFVYGQSETSPRLLQLGQNLERRLSDKEVHAYSITSTPGQYNRLIVHRLTANTTVALHAPDGQVLYQGQCNGVLPCVYSWLANSPGEYCVEIKPIAAGLAAGWYEIQLAEQRPATASDASRVVAEAALLEGRKLWQQRATEKAQEQYQQALAGFQALRDQRMTALTLMSMALQQQTLNQGTQAREWYEQALALWRATGDRKMEAQTLADIGSLLHERGETLQALAQYQQALALQRASGDRWGEAASLHELAGIYGALDDVPQSLDYYNQTYQLLLALGETSGAAFALNNLGIFYLTIGDYERAIEYFQQTIPLSQTGGDERTEAGMHRNMGYAYRLMGELAKAMEFYTRGLALTQAKNFVGQESAFLADLGKTSSEYNEHQKALDYYLQSLALRQKRGNRHAKFIGHCLVAVGYDKVGEHQKALDHLKQANALWPTANDNSTKEITLKIIGDAYADIGENELALGFYDRLLAMARARDSRSGEAEALARLARIAAARGELEAARTHIEAALTLHETLRGKLSSDELRSSYFAKVKQHYQLHLDILMRLHRANPTAGFDAAAFQANERTRARTLLEMLREARLNIQRGGDPELLARERALRQQLSTKAAWRARLPEKDAAAFAAATAEINAIEREYEILQAQLRTTSSQYAALFTPQPLNTRAMQQMLDDNTMLLEYALGDEQSYLWSVTPTTLTTFTLPKRAEIEAAARRLYTLLTARQPVPGETSHQYRTRVAKADAEYNEAAAHLSQMILSPAAHLLSGKRLLIVADGALQYVPFAALPELVVGGRLSVVGKQPATSNRQPTTGNRQPATDHRPPTTDHRQPLIVNHEIINLPSAAVLSVLRQAAQERKPAPRSVAVIADPVFEANDPRRKARSQPTLPSATREGQQFNGAVRARLAERGSLSRLPFTREEAKAIRALAPDAVTALDFKASKAFVTAPELAQYRIVHFATHGLLEAAHPALSGIVLSLVNERGEPQDGYLRLHEIYNLDLSADLVVLSACQTALGREVWGEGMIGLTRGFMHAGAQRVLSSLWKVSDSTTADVMQRFYRALLKQGKSPAAALRATQLEMRQQQQWQAPYYWAAFALQGEYR
ncbi:MAG TPA: CHAT domain-containing tetratricopeptide repeat protein [Blastocatellia bacterium]|nr:CHAT domain-containing tetratricopeptide repeat protein [Blastocatellia bacterium]